MKGHMAEDKTNSAAQVVTLSPSKGWLGIDLRELWHYRELIYFLTWRDIKVRYKQATLGIAWAILQPMLTTAITSLVFGYLLKVDTGSLPYPVFTLAALLPWHLFQLSLQKSSISLVGNANLITKIYFPRIIIPLSSVLAVLVDFAISLILLFAVMLFFKLPFTWTMLWLIPLTLLAILAALAVGLLLSALNVQYRDIQQMVPFCSDLDVRHTDRLPDHDHSRGHNPLPLQPQPDGWGSAGLPLGALAALRRI